MSHSDFEASSRRVDSGSEFVSVRDAASVESDRSDASCADRMTGKPPDRLMKLDEVKRRVGLGKSMIYRLIQSGTFPAPYKVSPSASRWSDQEIVAWIDNVKDGFEGKRRKF